MRKMAEKIWKNLMSYMMCVRSIWAMGLLEKHIFWFFNADVFKKQYIWKCVSINFSFSIISVNKRHYSKTFSGVYDGSVGRVNSLVIHWRGFESEPCGLCSIHCFTHSWYDVYLSSFNCFIRHGILCLQCPQNSDEKIQSVSDARVRRSVTLPDLSTFHRLKD